MSARKRIACLLGIATLITSVSVNESWAHSNRTASGRRLRSDHWLTCWGGRDSAIRRDPPFNANSKESDVAAYIPHFQGSYEFDVKDTWEEEVAHHGEDCFHCGDEEDSKGNEVGCKTCSWTETETEYEPWSTQTVNWKITWAQDPQYRQQWQQWVAAGRPETTHRKDDVAALMKFDPNRPLEYYLFPGEFEEIDVGNGSNLILDMMAGGDSISPHFSISKATARYHYTIDTRVNGQSGERDLDCTDSDVNLEATVHTGDRIVGATPNSIEFKRGWIDGDVKGAQANPIKKQEPGSFQVSDVAAMLYENQNIYDNYKDTTVQIYLEQINRSWWIDRRISKNLEIHDNTAKLLKDENHKPGEPRYALFEIQESDLAYTPWTKTPFHLAPGRKYEVCARMNRRNNIYYKEKNWLGSVVWSDPNCAVFSYASDAQDLRSGGRKFHDVFSRAVPAWW